MAISDSAKFQDRYRLLFENSFEAMVIFAPGGEVLEVNQHMADMLGYPVDEIVGKSVFDLEAELMARPRAHQLTSLFSRSISARRSMAMYLLVPHFVPAMCLRRAATSIRAD